MYLNCQSLWNKLWVPRGSAKSSSPLCWWNVYSHPISFVIVAKNRKSSRLSKLSRCLQSIIWHLCRYYDTSRIAWAYLEKKSVYKLLKMVSKQVSNLTYFPFLFLWKYIYFFKYILHRVFSYIKNLLNNPLLLKCLLLLLYTVLQFITYKGLTS